MDVVTEMSAEQSNDGSNFKQHDSMHDPVIVQAFYRIRQFARGVTATVSDAELELALALLPDAAQFLFLQMPVDAQRHSLNVLATLQEAGYTDPSLAAAALLHDAGKVAADHAGVGISVWLRGPLVLMDALGLDESFVRSSDEPSQGWRYALYVHREHPEIGAGWAKEAGCNELTCWLIGHHQDRNCPSQDQARQTLLTALQWADNRN